MFGLGVGVGVGVGFIPLSLLAILLSEQVIFSKRGRCSKSLVASFIASAEGS